MKATPAILFTILSCGFSAIADKPDFDKSILSPEKEDSKSTITPAIKYE
jgi:hypothetical protein